MTFDPSSSAAIISSLLTKTTKLVTSVQDRQAAAELREIQLLISDLQTFNMAITSKYHDICIERSKLKEDLNSLKQQKRVLEEKILDLQNPSDEPQIILRPEQTKILNLMFEKNVSDGLTANQIANLLGFSEHITQFHIDTLCEKKLLKALLSVYEDSSFLLTTEGRKYAFGLLEGA